MARTYLIRWLVEALEDIGSSGSIIKICKQVWAKHGQELKNRGDDFYTWQYDIRWAATELRKHGKLKQAHESPKGVWELQK